MDQEHSIIFGINPLRELLHAKRRPVVRVYVANPTPQAFSGIRPLIPAHVPVVGVPRELLTARAGTADHQGVVAVVGHLPIRSRPFDPDKHPFLVLLDGVQDPRNVGAIIRSISCVGADGVIIPRKQSAPLGGVVCKASAGLIEHVAIYQPASSVQAVQELKAAGYRIYCAMLNGTDIRTVSYQMPLCLVIGSEGAGITPAISQQGVPITIPQRTGAGSRSAGQISYNAAVAAGILLYTIAGAIRPS